MTPQNLSTVSANINSPLSKLPQTWLCPSRCSRSQVLGFSIEHPPAIPAGRYPGQQGLVTYLIAVAREMGVSAYVGDGLNRWPAVHWLDAAHLYKLVFEKGSAGVRYNAVAEEGVPLREIAEAIGRGLKVPVVSKSPGRAGEHLGWLSVFVSGDMPASSALTQKRLGWRPTQTGLISDLNHARDFGA